MKAYAEAPNLIRALSRLKPGRIAELRILAATGTQGPKSAAIIELCDALESRQQRQERPKFTLGEVKAEASKMDWPAGLAEECYDSCQEVGWVRGKNKIPYSDLPATMRNWKRRHEKWNGKAGKTEAPRRLDGLNF